MPVSEEQLNSIVSKVLGRLQPDARGAAPANAFAAQQAGEGIFPTLDDALKAVERA